MNFHKLTIQTNQNIKDIKSHHFRQTLLAIFDDLALEDKVKLNFHMTDHQFNSNSRKIPYVLFGFPYKKTFSLYGYNEDNKLLELILKKLPISFYSNKQRFDIVNKYIESFEIIPIIEKTTYKTITPMLFFTGNRRKCLDAILIKENPQTRDKVIKEKLQKMLIENVRYQTQQLLKDKPYSQFDEITLFWIEFKFIRLQVRGKTEYGAVGTFESNYRLPKFIGHKIGFGYGQIAPF